MSRLRGMYLKSGDCMDAHFLQIISFEQRSAYTVVRH